MSLLRALSVFAVIAACGGAATQKRVRKPGDEYLAAIKFEGVSLSHENLLSGLALKRNLDAGRSIDEYQLNLDVQRIAGLYQRRGFFSVKVVPRVERKGDAATLIFHVDEGERAVATVVITGLPPEVPFADARAAVPVPNDSPFDYDLFDEGKAPLLALVENAGYAHAQLDAQVLADRGKGRATLRYALDPGTKVTFGKVTITGVTDALAEAARNRLPFREGDPYSTKQVADAEQAIYGIGRFASARVDVDRMSEATVLPVKVVLTEQKPWEAKLGGGAGFDSLTYQARLRASLTHDGWPTPLTRLGAEFRPALTALRSECKVYEVWNCDFQPRIRLIGTASQQDFLRRDVRADMEGGLDYLKLEAYTTQGERVKLSVGMPLANRRIDVRLGWQFAYYGFDDYALVMDDGSGKFVRDENLVTKTGTASAERLGAFSETVAFDWRDNPITPHLGAYAELRVTQGGSWAGGAFDYVQLMPDLRGYLPLGKAVLAGHVRYGAIFGDVAPTERFYAGGAASQRGFPERYLSPFVTGIDRDDHTKMTNVPIGGAGLLETGLELRVPFELFNTQMGAAAFLDGADVTEQPDDIDPTNLHWAAGISLRPYYLPIGPIRLDFAWRLNRTNSDTAALNPLPGEHFSFVFSLGEAF
ncbi:MAG TPA: BamA/TamA family outer membrane protein [Kofleriaceae bacterium]|nr:BamA/TamA family outer membrane protein [Kofleriaceae bacterium]